MMTVDDILEECRKVKAYSSRITLPIVYVERLCEAARAWDEAPQELRDAIKWKAERDG